MNKVKKTGEVFTPLSIVKLMLDNIGYQGKGILHKHIIDNSAGQGAFIVEIIDRYINESVKAGYKNNTIITNLEKYIHGIEIDTNNYKKLLENVDSIANDFGLENVEWDFLNEDAMDVSVFNNKMDFVIGNPPYVRIHNFGETFDKIRSLKFTKKGMSDLYIVFFEIGINMLKHNGILSYITPNSVYNSQASSDLRNWIFKNKCLKNVIDLGHYNPFPVSTYTSITTLGNGLNNDEIEYYELNNAGQFVNNKTVNLYKSYINGIFYFGTDEELTTLSEILSIKRVGIVKNGLGTLADKVFINVNINDDENVLPIIKASTGEISNVIYPYDKNGDILTFDELSYNVKKHLDKHKETLLNRSIDNKDQWYLYGRSQAVRDVYSDKVSVNQLLRESSDLKIKFAGSGTAVYSGLYILSLEKETIESIIYDESFIRYIKLLKHYKSGGYYTFSSKELELFILFKLNKDKDI